MRVVVPLVVISLFASSAFAGPVFPTRGILIDPRWTGKVDTTSVFDHSSYWAHVQHGFNSDSDRWGWSISMGAIWEFARWGGNRSLLAFTGMELTADTHNDIYFNPRGAYWEEGLMYCVNESNTFDWSIGSVYRCRHDIDNADPGQYEGYNQQRTLIYCSLDGRGVWHPKLQHPNASGIISAILPTLLWSNVRGYLIREDYRLPDTVVGLTEYNKLAWSAGEGGEWNLKQWERGSLYFTYNVNFSFFGNRTGFLSRFGSIATVTADDRFELGYTYEGRAGRIQLYGGYESWQDDGQVPIPRDARYAILGVRVTGSDLVTY